MKKRIMAFALAAMLGAFSCMPILDVRAEPENVGKEPLHYESEFIRKDFAECVQNCAQSDPTVDLPEEWRTYSVSGPVGEYGA